MQILAGAASGCLGSALFTPTDLVKIRLQSYAMNAKLLTNTNTNISQKLPSIMQVWTSVYKNEGGIQGLWQGAGPNIQRAALVTAAQVC